MVYLILKIYFDTQSFIAADNVENKYLEFSLR